MSRVVRLRSGYLSLILFALAATATSLPVQAVAPRVASLLPTGGQRGTAVEVRFGGERLDDAKEVVFYSPGISLVALGETKSKSVKATLRIESDCRLGEHHLRLRTATGISEIRTFWVGALTNVAEAEPNNELAKPQEVPLNCTITGTIPGEDVDYFLVKAERGTRLSAEVEAMRLGRGAFDPYLSIMNKTGQVLAAAEDTPLLYQDAAVSILVPESAEYLILLRETSFSGRDDYHYRLHIGDFPRPTAVYPPGARVGTEVRFRFIGDPAGDLEQVIRLPAAAQDKFAVFASQPTRSRGPAAAASSPTRAASTPDHALAPSPNWIHLTTYPTASEIEPNDTREQVPLSSSLDAPVVYNGVIGQPDDHDWFRFRARKGQTLTVSVFARRLRSPLDSTIQVVNAKGAAVADNDDGAGPDSLLTFKPDEDGEYAVLVRDHLRRGGPSFVYCLEIAPAESTLTLKIPEVARNDTQSRQYIAVPRGNQFATLLSAKRANFSGELDFHIEDLPEGMHLIAQSVPAKIDQFPIVFEAASNAPVSGKLLDLMASAASGPTGHYRNDIELVQGPNNSSYINTRVDRLLVAVTEAAPFKIRILEPKVSLLQGGSMDLQIAVERDPGFTEPITVKMVWNPPGITSQPDIIIPKDAATGTYVLNAKGDAELRSWPLTVLASAKVNGGDLFVSSQLANIQIGPPFVSAKIETTACSPGHTTNILVKLEQLKPFDGQATIRLMGLSDKVSVSEQQITKDDHEISFPVKVDPACPTGSQRNLFCVVTVKKDGELLTHNAGQGGVLRVVPARKPTSPGEPKKVAKNP